MIEDGYDITNKSYEDFTSTFYPQWKDTNIENPEQADKFLSMLPKTAKILDVGAGFGKDMAYFIEKGFECVGIDNSDSFIEIAKEKNPQCNIIKSDFRDFQFKENEFDGVWSRGALFHLSKDDFKQVISKIAHVLKPGGVIYLLLIEGDFEGIRSIGETDAKAYYSHYTKTELRALMLSNRFKYHSCVSMEGWINDYYINCKQTK